MSITLKIECSPGSDISDAFQEAIELSNRIKVALEFDFNGVTCFVKPGGSVRVGVDEYHQALKAETKHKFARSY